ncbi:hypothetical protein BH10CYA1_BH10CYA1_63510 [soil metagenome]
MNQLKMVLLKPLALCSVTILLTLVSAQALLEYFFNRERIDLATDFFRQVCALFLSLIVSVANNVRAIQAEVFQTVFHEL